MLPSFEVKNFRTFSHLQIPRLGGVNLIVGRNNVGKTMLLEALRLYAAEGDINAILGLLYDRDEVLPSPSDEPQRRSFQIRFASLFHGRTIPDIDEPAIVLQCGRQDDYRVRVVLETQRIPVNKIPSSIIYSTGFLSTEGVDLPVVHIHVGEREVSRYLPSASLQPNRDTWTIDRKRLAQAFVPAAGVDSRTLARQWDAIALRAAVEEQVIECLRIVAPIERITSVEHPANSGQRMFVVRTAGAAEPVPLKSLGDGMVRMFQLALALESAKSGKPAMPAGSEGVFLIDEIENGIHYTVLHDLWRFLFRMARIHNVQVFATTHSWDCVESFQRAAAEDEETEGMLIRLEKRDDRDEHKVVTFSEEELAIVARDQIEVR